MPFPNEVFIEPKDKERLIELLTEANSILNKYPYSSDYSHHTVTSMSRAKTQVNQAMNQVKRLYTIDNIKHPTR